MLYSTLLESASKSGGIGIMVDCQLVICADNVSLSGEKIRTIA